MNEYISIIIYYFELSGIFQEQGTHFIGRLEVMKLNNKLMLGFQKNQSFFHDTWPKLSIPTRCRRSAERTLVRGGQRLFSGLICKIIYSVCQWNFYLFQGEVKPWSRRTKITHGVFLGDLLYSTSKGSCNKPFGSYVNYLRRLLRFNHIYFAQQKHNAKYL